MGAGNPAGALSGAFAPLAGKIAGATQKLYIGGGAGCVDVATVFVAGTSGGGGVAPGATLVFVSGGGGVGAGALCSAS